MAYNLENIPACLRIIARQIEKGDIKADFGVLTLRKKGAVRPTVYGFGPENQLNPHQEMAKASAELNRLAGPPAQRA